MIADKVGYSVEIKLIPQEIGEEEVEEEIIPYYDVENCWIEYPEVDGD